VTPLDKNSVTAFLKRELMLVGRSRLAGRAVLVLPLSGRAVLRRRPDFLSICASSVAEETPMVHGIRIARQGPAKWPKIFFNQALK
jgi:hypothetical protein